MGANNFYNHENGIFVLQTPGYDEVLELEVERLLDEGDYDEELAMKDFNNLLEEEKEKIRNSGESILVQMAKRTIDGEDIYQEMNFLEEIESRRIFVKGTGLNYELELKGISLEVDENDDYRARAYSKSGKLLAELILESGYYNGAQIIVETDPYVLLGDDSDLFYNERIQDIQDEFVKSKLNEVYSKHNKTLFKVIENYTTPIKRVIQFSDGTAIYEAV